MTTAQPQQTDPTIGPWQSSVIPYGSTFEVTATKLSCGWSRVGDKYVGESAQGRYCIVQVRVQNSSDEPDMIVDDDFSLFDPKGREFATDTEAMISNGGSSDLRWEDINPSNTANGPLVFDSSLFGGDPATISLH